MKCVKLNSGKVLRVNNEYADVLVRDKKAIFIDRKKWKEDGREYLTELDKQQLNKKEVK